MFEQKKLSSERTDSDSLFFIIRFGGLALLLLGGWLCSIGFREPSHDETRGIYLFFGAVLSLLGLGSFLASLMMGRTAGGREHANSDRAAFYEKVAAAQSSDAAFAGRVRAQRTKRIMAFSVTTIGVLLLALGFLGEFERWAFASAFFGGFFLLAGSALFLIIRTPASAHGASRPSGAGKPDYLVDSRDRMIVVRNDLGPRCEKIPFAIAGLAGALILAGYAIHLGIDLGFDLEQVFDIKGSDVSNVGIFMLSLLIFFIRQRLEIDKRQNKASKSYHLLFFRFGRTYRLDEFDQVLLVKREVPSSDDTSVSQSASLFTHEVFLSGLAGRISAALFIDDHPKAAALARKLSEYTGHPVEEVAG